MDRNEQVYFCLKSGEQPELRRIGVVTIYFRLVILTNKDDTDGDIGRFVKSIGVDRTCYYLSPLIKGRFQDGRGITEDQLMTYVAGRPVQTLSVTSVTWNALQLSCALGKAATARTLLMDYRADPSIEDETGRNAYDIACYFGHQECVNLFFDVVPRDFLGIMEPESETYQNGGYRIIECKDGKVAFDAFMISPSDQNHDTTVEFEVDTQKQMSKHTKENLRGFRHLLYTGELLPTILDADVLRICEIAHLYEKKGYILISSLIAICLAQIQKNLTPQSFCVLYSVVFESDVLFAHKLTRQIFNFYYSSRKKDISITELGFIRTLVEEKDPGHIATEYQARTEYLSDEIQPLKERLWREQYFNIEKGYKFIIESKTRGKNFVLQKSILRTVEYFDLLHRHFNISDSSRSIIKEVESKPYSLGQQLVNLEFSAKSVMICMKYIYGYETNHKTLEKCSFSELFDIHIMSDQMNLVHLKSSSFLFMKYQSTTNLMTSKLMNMTFVQEIIDIYTNENCYTEIREVVVEMMKKSITSRTASQWISICDKKD